MLYSWPNISKATPIIELTPANISLNQFNRRNDNEHILQIDK